MAGGFLVNSSGVVSTGLNSTDWMHLPKITSIALGVADENCTTPRFSKQWPSPYNIPRSILTFPPFPWNIKLRLRNLLIDSFLLRDSSFLNGYFIHLIQPWTTHLLWTGFTRFEIFVCNNVLLELLYVHLEVNLLHKNKINLGLLAMLNCTLIKDIVQKEKSAWATQYKLVCSDRNKLKMYMSECFICNERQHNVHINANVLGHFCLHMLKPVWKCEKKPN